MNVKKVAIIGSNGFIGKHLTEKLSQNPSVELSLFGKSANSAFGNQYSYHKLDLLNSQQVNLHFEDIDVVYYLASETIPATSWDNPLIEIEKNLLPFINFLECLSALKTKKVVFLSSAGTVYGHSVESANEESNKSPFSPYGIVKLAMENFLNYYKNKYQLNFDIYRVSNVYGEGQDTSKGLGIINTFIEKIISDKKINIYGDGKNVRNYIYVKDVAELLSCSVNSDMSSSDIFNLSSNDTLSINELVTIMQSVISEKFDIIYSQNRQSDNLAIKLDNTKIVNAYPNFRFTQIEDGILKTYQFIKKATINQLP